MPPNDRGRAEPSPSLDEVIAATDKRLRAVDELLVVIGAKVQQLRSQRNVVEDRGDGPRDVPDGKGD